MKKRHIFLAATASFAVWAGVTYPKIGHISYDLMQSSEVYLAGLSTKSATVTGSFGEESISYFENEKPSENAETILLIHGYSADKNNWNRLAKHLSDTYHLIIPDIGGHGDNAFVDGKDYSAPVQAERMHALMRSKGIKKAHIGGSSLGGFITAYYGLNYPDDVLSLALFNPYGVVAPSPSITKSKLVDEGKNVFQIHNREEMDYFLELAMEDPPFLPGMARSALTERYIERRDELTKLHKHHWENKLVDNRLGELKARTLIVWGQQDEILDVTAAAVWHKGIPNSELTVWEGVGHLPMLERPEETAQRYLMFLQQ